MLIRSKETLKIRTASFITCLLHASGTPPDDNEVTTSSADSKEE